MNAKQHLTKDRFIILGDKLKIESFSDEEIIKKIIQKKRKSKLAGIWGTLGWEDDRPFPLVVKHSRYGNTSDEERDISTKLIINHIKRYNTKIKTVHKDVLERYISFDNSDFGINWQAVKNFNDIPGLRLDLFVDDDEGAMVYYVHQKKNKLGNRDDKTIFEQFIQCRKTDDEFTTKRDRLTYFFKILPPKQYTVNHDGSIDWNRRKRNTTFVVKIITFKRSKGTPGEILKEFFSHENLVATIKSKGVKVTYPLFGKQKYGLLVYDPSVRSCSVASSDKNRFTMRGAFYPVDESHPIDRAKKTLLLIHGTFSNTLKSFEDLVKLSTGNSVLEDFLKKSGYTQVIAFDHPTVSADVFDNVEELLIQMGNEPFTQGIGILAASRGCQLAQAIGAEKKLPFRVEKCLMFSPANGVGYFDLGGKLATGLGILKKLTKGTPASYIFALLQFSAEYFLDQPGAQQMTFGSDRLNKILEAEPAYPDSKYTAVINDWEKILAKRKKFWAGLLDGAIKLILGSRHDFVVGSGGQTNLPAKFNVLQVPMTSTHCKYFEKGELLERNGKETVLSDFMAKYL